MSPQRRLGIYVGFRSTSIIQYLEPLTGNLFTARFADCHFDESVFLPLGGDKPIYNKWCEITWNTPSLLHLDPRTKQSELEVQRILHLQDLADQLPDAFINPNKVIKSHIPAVNTPTHIEIPIGDSGNAIASTSKPRLKRGRPIRSKDSFPRKRKSNKFLTPVKYSFDEITPEEPITIQSAPVELNTLQGLKETVTRVAVTDQLSPMNEEISINYMNQGEIWDRRNALVSNAFSFQVAKGIMQNNDDQEPQTINECRNRQDWEKWKEAIQVELNCLAKREVFRPVVPTPENVKPVGYRWVFVRKRNENNEIVRYKARLVAQGFSQRPGIDYEETYSPVMDAITFRYLIQLVVSEGLEMHLMDVVTTYLYGSIDSDIYMKIPEGFPLPEAKFSKPRGMYSIKLQRSLYGLKQSGRMWYNRLSTYLLREGYVNNSIFPCVFIKKT